MAGSTWQVTGQLTNQVKNTPTGGTVEGNYVYFTTGDGNAGAAFIPNNIYHNKKKVHAAIAAEANAIDEVGQMTDGMVP